MVENGKPLATALLLPTYLILEQMGVRIRFCSPASMTRLVQQHVDDAKTVTKVSVQQTSDPSESMQRQRADQTKSSHVALDFDLPNDAGIDVS